MFVRKLPLDRVVLEISEGHRIDDYAALHASLESLRADGVRLAIDDAGAGFATFDHMLKLRPDLIKLDISLNRHVKADTMCQALTSAMVTFGARIGAQLVAEGVEDDATVSTLQRLGVQDGQGFHLGRPAPLEELRLR